MTACSQSPEQKAEVLIKDYIKKDLVKPDTYKPVETKVDSAFAPYDDPAFLKELSELSEMNSEYEILEAKSKDAKSSMSIWGMSGYYKNKYDEAKEEYEEVNMKMEKLKKKGLKKFDRIVSLIQGEKTFVGFKAVHNYRSENNFGLTLIGNTIFFIDKTFENVTYSMDVEEYNQLQEATEQLKEQIKEEES